jgi:conjugative transfer region protein TrbK
MDGKTLARVGAIIFVSVAITATAIEMTRKEERPAVRPTPVPEEAEHPLREGQRRCQQMGEAAARDSECLRIWAETRHRFLGSRKAPQRADEGR